MNRIRFKVRNPYSENRETVATQEPIAPPVAFFLLWEIMPVVAVNLNNKTTIRNQEITDQPINGRLGNVFNAQRIKEFSYCPFWLASKHSPTSIISGEREVMALNGTEMPITLFNTILGSIKLLATLFTGSIFTSSASSPLARHRTKPLARIKGWLKYLATDFTGNRFKPRSNSFAFKGTKLPSLFAPMLKSLTTNLASLFRIAAACTKAGQRTKTLAGWHFSYYDLATVFTGELT